MGKVDIDILLDPNMGVYFPGQYISGVVHAQVYEPQKCRDVVISCKGKSKTHWTEKVGEEWETRSDTDISFKNKSVVYRPDYDGYIPPGEYHWPFTFLLPNNVPSSFEGEYGYVRYNLKAKVDIPMASDTKTTIYFSVNDSIDLNSCEASQNLDITKTGTACCLCCTKGPVSIRFNCPRAGAVIGESYRLRGEIENNGNKVLKSTAVRVKQHVRFYADGHTKTNSRTIVEIEKGEIEPGDSEMYADDPIKIPAVCPSLMNCRIMDLKYEIEFEAYYGMCKSVSVTAPFVIGTIPFKMEAAFAPPPPYMPTMDPNAPQPPNGFFAVGFAPPSHEGFAPPLPQGYAPPLDGYAVPQGLPPNMVMHPQMGLVHQARPSYNTVQDSYLNWQPLCNVPLPPNCPYPIRGPPQRTVSVVDGCRLNESCDLPFYITYDGVIDIL